MPQLEPLVLPTAIAGGKLLAFHQQSATLLEQSAGLENYYGGELPMPFQVARVASGKFHQRFLLLLFFQLS